jgi:carbamoylphosphate synthase small subunit
MNLDWVKEIDYNKYLDDEYSEIVELIGIDNFLKLINRYGKMNMYFSTKPLDKLREVYIKKNRRADVKDLARTLEVSTKYIYNVRAGAPDINTMDMFPEEA